MCILLSILVLLLNRNKREIYTFCDFEFYLFFLLFKNLISIWCVTWLPLLFSSTVQWKIDPEQNLNIWGDYTMTRHNYFITLRRKSQYTLMETSQKKLIYTLSQIICKKCCPTKQFKKKNVFLFCTIICNSIFHHLLCSLILMKS